MPCSSVTLRLYVAVFLPCHPRSVWVNISYSPYSVSSIPSVDITEKQLTLGCGIVTEGQLSLANAKGFLLLFTVNKPTNQPAVVCFCRSVTRGKCVSGEKAEEIAYRSLCGSLRLRRRCPSRKTWKVCAARARFPQRDRKSSSQSPEPLMSSGHQRGQPWAVCMSSEA